MLLLAAGHWSGLNLRLGFGEAAIGGHQSRTGSGSVGVIGIDRDGPDLLLTPEERRLRLPSQPSEPCGPRCSSICSIHRSEALTPLKYHWPAFRKPDRLQPAKSHFFWVRAPPNGRLAARARKPAR